MNTAPQVKRPPLFPTFTPDHLAQLVTLCCFVHNHAKAQGKVALAIVAEDLASNEGYRRPFLRWCWLNRLDVLTAGASSLPEAMLTWLAAGQPDGMDCCLQCGRGSWSVRVEPEAVPTAVGGFLITGNQVVFGSCSNPRCLHGQLMDVLA